MEVQLKMDILGGRRLTQTQAVELRRHELEKEKLERKQKQLQKSLSREQLDLSRKLHVLSAASPGGRRSFKSVSVMDDVSFSDSDSIPSTAGRICDKIHDLDEIRGSLPDIFARQISMKDTSSIFKPACGKQITRHLSIDPVRARTRSIDRRNFLEGESSSGCGTAETIDDGPEWRKQLVQRLAEKENKNDRRLERAELSAMVSGCPLGNKYASSNGHRASIQSISKSSANSRQRRSQQICHSDIQGHLNL